MLHLLKTVNISAKLNFLKSLRVVKWERVRLVYTDIRSFRGFTAPQTNEGKQSGASASFDAFLFSFISSILINTDIPDGMQMQLTSPLGNWEHYMI